MDDEADYPYGRHSTAALRVYDDTFDVRAATRDGFDGDDDGFYMETDDGQFYVLYEAPREDDPMRGHLSVWFEVGDGVWKNVFSFTGDDGMIHDRFMQIQQSGTLPDDIDEERIERLQTDG